jgi:hypothetical protein
MVDEYFDCDYTSRTCQKGWVIWNLRNMGFEYKVYYLLNGDDRKTVIGHGVCKSELVTRMGGRGYFPGPWTTCWNLDTGEWKQYAHNGGLNGGGKFEKPDCYTNPEDFDDRQCHDGQKWLPHRFMGGYKPFNRMSGD